MLETIIGLEKAGPITAADQRRKLLGGADVIVFVIVDRQFCDGMRPQGGGNRDHQQDGEDTEGNS